MTYELDPDCEICNNLHIYKECWACSTAKEQEKQMIEDLKIIEAETKRNTDNLIEILTTYKSKDIYKLLTGLKTKNKDIFPYHLQEFITLKFSVFDYKNLLNDIMKDDRLNLSKNDIITQANILLTESIDDNDFDYIIYCLNNRKNYNSTTEYILTNLSEEEIESLLTNYVSNYESKFKEYQDLFIKMLPITKYKPYVEIDYIVEDDFLNNIVYHTLHNVAPKYAWDGLMSETDYKIYINIEERISSIVKFIIDSIINNSKYDYIETGRKDGEGIFRSKEELNLHEQWLRTGCTLTAIMKQKTVNLFKSGKEDREYMASVMHYDIQNYLNNNCPPSIWTDIIKRVCTGYGKIKHHMTVKNIMESTIPLNNIKNMKDLKKNKDKNRATYISKLGKSPKL